MTKWTAEDVAFLKSNYSGYHKRVYDKFLTERHSMFSIYKKASQLGLTHRGRKPFVKDGLKVTLTPEQAAYIAGIVDGEGWITVQRNMYYQVGVGNTNLQLLEWMRDILQEGKIKKRLVTNPRHKPRWELVINGSLVVKDLLGQIEQYMIIKRSRAQEAIKYIRSLL